MDFRANTNELIDSSSQIDLYYNELLENINRLKEALEKIKLSWIDESSKTFVTSFESYLRQLEQLFSVYNRLSVVIKNTMNRYLECDELSSKGAYKVQDYVVMTK